MALPNNSKIKVDIVSKTETDSQEEFDSEELLNIARFSIGHYCMTSCKSKCCSQGSIIVYSIDNVNAMSQSKERATELLDKKFVLARKDGYFEFQFDKCKCPSLTSDMKCSIFNSEFRPKMCKEFPLFIRGNLLVVSSFCPAVKDGTFDPYLKEFENKGFKILLQ